MSDRHLSHYSAPGFRQASPGYGARHNEAILRAEIRRLVRTLSPYCVLSRDALSREVGAAHWNEPWFERALDAAVEQGDVVALPLGFYGLPHHE